MSFSVFSHRWRIFLKIKTAFGRPLCFQSVTALNSLLQLPALDFPDLFEINRRKRRTGAVRAWTHTKQRTSDILTSYTVTSHCWSRQWRWGRGGRRVSAKGAWQHTTTAKPARRLNFSATEAHFLQISLINTSCFTASLTYFSATWQLTLCFALCAWADAIFFNRKGQTSNFSLRFCGRGSPQRLRLDATSLISGEQSRSCKHGVAK